MATLFDLRSFNGPFHILILQNSRTINILLSANEPYSYKSGENTELLTEDLNTFVREGLIDFWFWGNEYYCALYKRAGDAPFIGSCIGHGGFPYSRIERKDVKGDLRNRTKFLETRARFPRPCGAKTSPIIWAAT